MPTLRRTAPWVVVTLLGLTALLGTTLTSSCMGTNFNALKAILTVTPADAQPSQTITLDSNGSTVDNHGDAIFSVYTLGPSGTGARVFSDSKSTAGPITPSTTCTLPAGAYAVFLSVQNHSSPPQGDQTRIDIVVSGCGASPSPVNPPPTSLRTGDPLPSIALPDCTKGSAYDFTVPFFGGTTPLTVSALVATQVPSGLTLDADGRLHGTIPAASTLTGTQEMSLTVTDGCTPPRATNFLADLKLIEANGCPTLGLSSDLYGGPVGVAINQPVHTTGGSGTVTISLVSGSLPTGLSLTGGALVGTPTIVGSYSFTLQAVDQCSPTPQTVSQSYTLVIDSGCPTLTITVITFAAGQVGVPYSQDLNVSGGLPPLSSTISDGFLPPGLTHNGIHITGTPTAAGDYTGHIQVFDNCMTAPQQMAEQDVHIVVTN